METEAGAMQPGAKGCCKHKTPGEARKTLSQRLQRRVVLQTP